MTLADAGAGRYRIAEIAERSGFSPSTLRYYEQAGVLAAPARTPAGYRLYSHRDLERLRLIARAKDLGCTLDEITDLVQAWDSDECGPVKHRLRALVRDKVAQVETHLAEQAAFAHQLRVTADALAGRPLDGPCDDSCGCTTTTTSAAGGDCGAGCACGDVAEPIVPIACSLSGTDMGERIGQWRELLDDDAISRRPLRGGLRIEFGDRTRIADLAELVAAEQSCCPFFSFAITIDQRGLALEVTAPADGQELVATVFGNRA